MALDDVWEAVPDNDFARGLFNLLPWNAIKPKVQSRPPTLCADCNAINSRRLFKIDIDRNELESSSRHCDLCRLLHEALSAQENDLPKVISLRQNGLVVGLRDGPNLLSIYTDPDNHTSRGARYGLPKLPDHASPEQFLLLKEWIRVCDTTHGTCCHSDTKGSVEGPISAMPTRLIDLSSPLRLVQSTRIQPSPYVALSHCWGKTKTLRTTTENINQFLTSIEFHGLPKTFQDAIQVTRGIGIQYLWIDSLCIIQDDENDWEYESSRMDQIFSSAYCTISASSAESSAQGFLSDRKSRGCLQLEPPGIGRLYICPNIDDFHHDVELAKLNSRGWVLQERALSRRSIFYTTAQVYWECGAGVRCETLTRLHNSKAALLGDARFPNSALEYYRDGRQMLVQDLYERYSKLAFTYSSDRPLAILGLQKRLTGAFETEGAFGLFTTYFARLLLWRRSSECPMTRINQRSGIHPRAPTWSWFSKVGAIKYLDLSFQEIDWSTEDFINPLSSTAADTGRACMTLRGQARKLIPPEDGLVDCVVLDEGGEAEADFDALRCVVIGRDKTWKDSGDAKYHILIIRRLKDDMYERVGVASLKVSYVAWERCWVRIQ